jgi:chorismate mutase
MATLMLELEHRSGILSSVLSQTAGLGGNVLMINQTIPLQGTANVFMTIDSSQLRVELFALTDSLKRIPGVKKAALVGQGSPTGEIV